MRAKLASFIAAFALLAAMAGCGNTMKNDEARAAVTPAAAATGSPRSTANSGVVGEGLVGNAADAMDDAGSAVGNAVGGVGKAAGDVVSGVGDAVGDAIGSVGNAVGDIAGGVGDAVDGNRAKATANPTAKPTSNAKTNAKANTGR